MQGYVKDFHTTGLSWNPKGEDALKVSTSTTTASSSGDLPPPPPPVDHEKLRKMQEDAVKKSKSSGTVDTAALFNQINAIDGEGKKTFLKQVKKEERNLYSKAIEKGETVKPQQEVKKATDNKSKKKRITGTPVLELKDNKWQIENHDGNKNIQIQVEVPKHAIYVSKCDNSLINITGKFNSITLDDCQKTTVSFDQAVASCDVVNCKSVKIEVRGTIPTVLIDKSDGAYVYLSKTSFDTSIITSKSSELNVSVAIGNDEYKEMAIPEQYISKYDPQTGKLATVINSHLG